MATRDSQSIIATKPILRRASMRAIRSIATKIANKYQPEKIILFGSYAYGRPTPLSDIDLLVIMNFPKNEVEAAREILKYLPPQPFSIDLLVRSQETIEKRLALGDWFLREITAQGMILYERDNPRMGQ